MSFANQSLGFKLTLLLSVVLCISFGATTFLVVHQVGRTIDDEAAWSARSLAQFVADGTQSFGQIGDMDGLRNFLDTIKQNNKEVEVRAVRAAGTFADYGERKGAPVADALELEVVKSGKTASVTNIQEHYLRVVVPLFNGPKCVDCHQGAKPGEVLGTSSSKIDTIHLEDVKNSITLRLLCLFVGAILVVLLTLLWFLRRTVVAPLMTLNQVAGQIARGDIRGAELMLHGEEVDDPAKQGKH